jgi:acyl-coenzyme A synthetase/AMP-(fatty) acid ligase
VDGTRRLSYEQFFARCDRWSASLQRLGVRKGDRVVPKNFTFVAELPKTATGKIQKYVLRGGRAAISAQ